MTKKYKAKKNILKAFDISLTVGPLIYAIISGLITDSLTTHKVGLVMTIWVYVIFTIIAVVNKVNFKSKIWILLFGLWLVLDNILVTITIFGLCSIIDEIVITPTYKHYKELYKINKEIDKRG